MARPTDTSRLCDENGFADTQAWEEYQDMLGRAQDSARAADRPTPSVEAVWRYGGADSRGYPVFTPIESPGIGDVTSPERGSGARYIAGKAPLDLLPLAQVWDLITYDERAWKTPAAQCLFHLGQFQQDGDGFHLNKAWRELYLNEPLGVQLAEPARVLEYGRRKYAAWNWAKGQPWSVALACAARHILAMMDGELTDPESDQPHRGHVASNILFLLTFVGTYPEGNDLPTTLKPRNKEDGTLQV